LRAPESVTAPDLAQTDGEVFGDAILVTLHAMELWSRIRWMADSPDDLLILDLPKLAEESEWLSVDDIFRVIWYWRAAGIVTQIHRESGDSDSVLIAKPGPQFFFTPAFPEELSRGAEA
jgi:hypothetical protein